MSRKPPSHPLRVGVVMDPIHSIKIGKDSTFAMLLAAQARGWTLHYMEQNDLAIVADQAFANTRPLQVTDDPGKWFELGEPEYQPLHELDIILMRKDPPFDIDYIYTTYVLELAQKHGALVVNDPRSLRDCNEKAFTSWFPQCCTQSIITSDRELLHEFIREHDDVIVKPLAGMGGESIFRLRPNDPNVNVSVDLLTRAGRRMIIAQRFIPEISAGDKRILMINGEPVPYALARIARPGETRANLAVGGRGEGVELSERDHWICEQTGPELVRRGLLFVGLDVIGDYLTEVNITSPTCIRELNDIYGLDIAGQLMDCLEQRC